MYQSGLTVDDTPILRYELETKQVDYYVLPAKAGLDASGIEELTFNPLTTPTHFVLFRTVGTKDVGLGYANIPADPTGSTLSSAVSIIGAPDDANDIAVLVINASNGVLNRLNAGTIDQLAFPVEASKEVSIDFDLVGRVLLSTDTVDSTYEVNLVAARKAISIFKNPVFAEVDSDQISIAATDKSVLVTFGGSGPAGEFVSAPSISDFVITSGASGVVTISTLSAIRVSNTEVLIYGFSGLVITNFKVTALPSAIRTIPKTSPALTLGKPNQIGYATVTAGGERLIESGAAPITRASGLSFTISLVGGDLFRTSGANSISSGMVLNSGANGVFTSGSLVAKIGGVTVGATASSGVTLRAGNITASATGQSTLEVFIEISDLTKLSQVLTPQLVELTIANEYLVSGSVDLPVYTRREVLSLQARDRLLIQITE
jgi:hypothetical protein